MSVANSTKRHIADVIGLPTQLYRPAPILPRPIVATMGHCYLNFNNNPTLSNGTDTIGTFRKKLFITADCADLNVVVGNQTGDTPTTDDVTYSVAIEDASGNPYLLTWNGAASVLVKPGGLAQSDPIGLEFAKGDALWIRCTPSVASGKKWPTGPDLNGLVVAGEGYTAGADNTLTAGTGWVTANNVFANFPMCVLGTPTTRNVATIAIVGDSIAAGQGDSTGGYGNDLGYILRALNNNFGFMRVAKPGERMQTFATLTSRMLRARLLDGCTHATCELGVNDFFNGRTLVQMQTDFAAGWTALTRRGMKVYQCTITTRTTSTDSWATATNQTPTANESVRTAFNDWVRTVPAPLSGIFEVADLIEVNSANVLTRNGGRMITNGTANYYTADGLHFSGNGASLAAGGIDTSKFTIKV